MDIQWSLSDPIHFYEYYSTNMDMVVFYFLQICDGLDYFFANARVKGWNYSWKWFA